MSELTLYVKDGCPYCAAAKKHYTEAGKTFTEVNVPKTPGAKEKLLELTGGKSIVPVIVGDGEIKLGFGGG
ncbi:MAG: glutaredoxin family protein [candidate division Zixibacteria bacterium]|nr:glutaredoxin family protein [candidate division Zixibacteria bacterium]